MDLKSRIRDVPDFPKKGIVFRDITPLLKDPVALKQAIHEMKYHCLGKRIDAVVGIDSRGFILGSILAHELGVGFVPVRKVGKLPWTTIKEEYTLEYGTAALEMHKDAIDNGENVIIVDDLLATGGTALATAKLVEKLGGNVLSLLFLVELTFLKGAEKLRNYEVVSLIKY
ncbi:MAG: adenine phosphoribosyltransferase [Candidatus Aenigmarchaeota archaeon]|nr:adenine phosphoribosyltransferase [Candidatus Aenigmarchaeota archaeon]